MGKALRVLIIFIFLLGVGALVFAWMLYEKRLEFSERFNKFQKALAQLAAVVEREAPDKKAAGTSYEERDISDVTSRDVANPQRHNFWDQYINVFEENSPEMFVWGENEQRQIKKLFLTQPDANGNEQKVRNEIDPQNNKYRMDGPGTMQALLDSLVKRSKEQYNTLIETRDQLKRLREEYNKTVAELNSRKAEGRRDKKTIDDLLADKERLEGEIASLKRTISNLEQEIKELKDEIVEWKEKLLKKEKEYEALDLKTQQYVAQIDVLKDQIEKLKKQIIGDFKTDIVDDDEWLKVLPPGNNGRVVFVVNDLNFVVLQLDESFARLPKVLGENLDKLELEGIPLGIRRPGFDSPSGEFITRVRLRQVSRDKLLFIADILTDWQQAPVEVGDIVFF
ncbi:MAG: hypothetical protein FWF96_02120 [Kiritimatiellaeota bacterium]|nr:hypothetical protein [Kiritimatiellota bacterium]